jgi:peptidoglycan/xylan/chitin deacetylase (PgdA/CDA1 family)
MIVNDILKYSLQKSGIVVYRAFTGRNEACLTFDDGPTEIFTDELLHCLDNHGVKATFFVTGKNAQYFPGKIQKIAQKGHEIGNHSFSHNESFNYKYRDISKEYRDTEDVISRAQGLFSLIKTKWIRPPYGNISAKLIFNSIFNGRIIVLWSKDPEDFKNPDVNTIDKYFKDNIPRQGDILLLHDKPGISVAITEKIINIYKSAGILLVPLSSILGK